MHVVLPLKHVNFKLSVNLKLFFFKNASCAIIFDTIIAVFTDFKVGVKNGESLKLTCFKGKTTCVKYNIKKSHGPAFRFLGKPRFAAHTFVYIFLTHHIASRYHALK